MELAARYKELIEQLRAEKSITLDAEAEKLMFTEMFEVCLWGNATDLSLLTTLTYDDIHRLQGSKARKEAEKNILVNHLPAAYELLKKAQKEGKKERRVDFVLDNSGFELYVDLILAGYLLASGLATQIVLRPKSIPWFVSDVLPNDFGALLSAISQPKDFFNKQTEEEQLNEKTPTPLSDKEAEDLLFVFQHWVTLHTEGQLIMRPNRYWTTGGSFWRLPQEAPELYQDLQEAALVIFKGDLNYRKLTADVSRCPVLRSSLDNSELIPCRLNGTLPLPSALPLGLWALVRGLISCLCALARQTLLLDWNLARMKSSEPWRVVAVIQGPENGPGMASGRLSACHKGHKGRRIWRSDWLPVGGGTRVFKN